MRKYYQFKSDDFFTVLDNLYPSELYDMISFRINYSNLTRDNLDKLVNCINEIISNPIETMDFSKKEEPPKITCLDNAVVKQLEQYFSNDDLVFYGHGGNPEEIFKSGEFRCHYPNLDSHFLPLEYTDQSLSNLNDWPHLHRDKIAIMALNKHEYNLIYKTREKENKYDIEVNSIPIEYFIGYYDNQKKKFFPNKLFKNEHQYDPTLSLYSNDEKLMGLVTIAHSDNELINQFLNQLDNLKKIFLSCGEDGILLSSNGYQNVLKQVNAIERKLYSLQENFTPQFIQEVQKQEMLNDDNSSSLDDFEWDVDEEEKTTKK